MWAAEFGVPAGALQFAFRYFIDLCSNRLFDERICFRTIDSIIFFYLNFLLCKLLAFLRDCTDRFVIDLVGNQDCWFSQAKAHKSISLYLKLITLAVLLLSKFHASLVYFNYEKNQYHIKITLSVHS